MPRKINFLAQTSQLANPKSQVFEESVPIVRHRKLSAPSVVQAGSRLTQKHLLRSIDPPEEHEWKASMSFDYERLRMLVNGPRSSKPGECAAVAPCRA